MMRSLRPFLICIVFLSVNAVGAQVQMSPTESNQEELEKKKRKNEKEPYNMESEDSEISWRPFILELSTTKFGYGLTIEKRSTNYMAVRASGYTDLMFLNLGNKVTMGVIFDLLSYQKVSLRAGLEFGIQQKPESLFFEERITKVLIDAPVLIEFQIQDNLSFNIGSRSAAYRYLGIASFIEEISVFLLDSYHIGLRYSLN